MRVRVALSLMALCVACDDAEPPPQTAAPNKAAPAGAPVRPDAAPAPTGPKPAAHFTTQDTIDTTVDGKGQGPYEFTSRWHLQAVDVWAQVLAPYKGKKDLRYLEVGVFEGRSVVWMLENVLTHPSTRITALDLFMEPWATRFDHNVAAAKAGDRVVKRKGRSQETLRPLEADSFDIIYIDGSHTADDVLADAVLSFDLLKDGGILIFDDYAWPGRPEGGALPHELRPKIAVDAFVTAYRNYFELLHRGLQVVVRKRQNPCDPKDYCSPLGRYRYFWREFELRTADGKPVPLSDQERKLVELIARSKNIGDIDFHFDPGFKTSKAFAALMAKLELELPETPKKK